LGNVVDPFKRGHMKSVVGKFERKLKGSTKRKKKTERGGDCRKEMDTKSSKNQAKQNMERRECTIMGGG